MPFMMTSPLCRFVAEERPFPNLVPSPGLTRRLRQPREARPLAVLAAVSALDFEVPRRLLDLRAVLLFFFIRSLACSGNVGGLRQALAFFSAVSFLCLPVIGLVSRQRRLDRARPFQSLQLSLAWAAAVFSPCCCASTSC
jgi:hypothetical protein